MCGFRAFYVGEGGPWGGGGRRPGDWNKHVCSFGSSANWISDLLPSMRECTDQVPLLEQVLQERPISCRCGHVILIRQQHGHHYIPNGMNHQDIRAPPEVGQQRVLPSSGEWQATRFGDSKHVESFDSLASVSPMKADSFRLGDECGKRAWLISGRFRKMASNVPSQPTGFPPERTRPYAALFCSDKYLLN